MSIGSAYAVMTKFLANDREVVSSYDRMARAAKNYGSTATNQMDKVSRSANRTSTAFRNATKEGYKFSAIFKGILAANATRGVFNAMTQAVTVPARAFVEFDDLMVHAAAKFDGMGYQAKNFGANLDELKTKARSFAMGTRYSINEVSKSMLTLAESGWDKNLVYNIMPSIVKAGNASREQDLPGLTDMLTGMFNSFRLGTGDPVKDGQAFSTLLDQITQGALDARGGITDLKEALRTLSPIWQKSQSTAEAIAFSVTLLNNGFQPDTIATAGKNAIVRLTRPDIAAQLREIGVDITNRKTGKLKDMGSIYSEIAAAYKRYGVDPASETAAAADYHLFGAYALPGNRSIIDSLGDYQKNLDAVQNRSKGVVDGTSDVIDKFSAFNKIMMLASVAMDKAIEVFESFNKPGQKGIEGLIERIKNFDTRNLITGLRAVGDVLSTVWKIVEPLLPAVPYLIAMWATFATGEKILKGVKFLDEVHKMAKGIGMIEKVVGASTMLGKIKALGTALVTVSTPLLLITGALGWLGAYKSLTTGQDNMISKIAQELIPGLPKLEAGPDGRVGPAMGWGTDNPLDTYAPNSTSVAAQREREAKLRATALIEFANPPKGMKVNGTPIANPWIQMQMLGVNP